MDMPQINRVRIINFSYNNHHRNIIDETFDFFQGENALLNLKNGGGKSVLVQLLMQPVIPKTKLMGRRMEDFFRGKKTPAYVMIEWKLEDRGGYLLTGIAMANRTSRVRENDVSNNTIKYFTFTSHYREANPFDIANIPLVRREHERIFIEDYREARKRIAAKEKDVKFNVHLFDEEDKEEYRRYLETFNIFQDEWKSIVLKINESEGGVIEIFEKCKTSQQLMNDWILKSVEKVVNKEDRDHKKLEMMLENLVEEMISNEQYIYEKELYEDFLKKSHDLLQDLEELIQSLEKEERLKGRMASLYYFLKQEIKEMGEESDRQEVLMAASEAELDKIQLEERSKAYYDEKANVEKLEAELKEAEDKLDAVRQDLEAHEEEIAILEAAKEYRNIQNIRQEIAGILEEMDRIKSSSDDAEKIRNLEYSLKVAYGAVLKELRAKADELADELEQVEQETAECDKKLDVLDRENSRLQADTGALRSRTAHFEKTEEKICRELGLFYERNLLGEIEEHVFTDFFANLEQQKSALEEEKEQARAEIGFLRIRIGEMKERSRALRELENEKRTTAVRLGEKIRAYYEEEEALKPVFDRCGLDFKRRFHHQENRKFVKNQIQDLEKNRRSLELQVQSLHETIQSLKRGTLHVSKEFRQWLIDHDIEFETGENYLRKQTPAVREQLMKQNPVLPYSFLLYDDDLAKLKTMNIDCRTREMVPLLSFRDVTGTFSPEGRRVAFGEHLQVLCLFDRRMFAKDDLEEYTAELQEKLAAVEGQLSHYRGELETAREDLRTLEAFNYSENYIYELEEQANRIGKEITAIKEEMAALEQEEQAASEKITRLERRIVELDREWEDTDQRKQRAAEFQKENEAYLRDRRILHEHEETLQKIAAEKRALGEKKQALAEKRDELLEVRTELRGEIKRKEEQYRLYENTPEAEWLDEEIGVMEARLQALKGKITSDLEQLEAKLAAHQKDLKERKENLASYQLEEEQYRDIEYDSTKHSSLKRKLRALEKEEKHLAEIRMDLHGQTERAKGKLEKAEEEVKKLAEEPLPPSEIKLHFSARRKEEREKIKQAREKIKELDGRIREYERLTNKIEQQIEVSHFPVDPGYEVKRGIEEDHAELTVELKALQKENKQYENNLQNRYRDLKGKYHNRHIENILAGLDPLVEGAQLDRNKYYYLGERIMLNNETLEKLIRACEQRLANLEKNKRDMIQHSYLHAKQVYEEIHKIADNSSVRIDGRNRPVQMLRINMEPLSEVEEENLAKMESYIEECVQIIKRDMEEGKKIEEIRKKISKYMSTRELLHVLSDLGKMTISAYKIDINVQNSGYKTWEQVMKENSGGERFVSFFAVLVALMSYTRTSMKYVDDYERNTDTKVLIMDNPFGPISSEHLLKPLFSIAKKYNTQLICLTDLKQNSILNNFNLIYMIKIRQNVFGTSEYLQLEQQIRENADVRQDEKLEKAIFKAEEIDQISLFE